MRDERKAEVSSKNAARTADGAMLLTGDVKVRVPAGAFIQVASERVSAMDGGQVLEGAVRINLGAGSLAAEKANLTRAENGDYMIGMDSGTWKSVLK